MKKAHIRKAVWTFRDVLNIISEHLLYHMHKKTGEFGR